MTACELHVEGTAGYVAFHARLDWLRAKGYRLMRCAGCGRPRILLAPDGRYVRSFGQEYQRLRRR